MSTAVSETQKINSSLAYTRDRKEEIDKDYQGINNKVDDIYDEKHKKREEFTLDQTYRLSDIQKKIENRSISLLTDFGIVFDQNDTSKLNIHNQEFVQTCERAFDQMINQPIDTISNSLVSEISLLECSEERKLQLLNSFSKMKETTDGKYVLSNLQNYSAKQQNDMMDYAEQLLATTNTSGNFVWINIESIISKIFTQVTNLTQEQQQSIYANVQASNKAAESIRNYSFKQIDETTVNQQTAKAKIDSEQGQKKWLLFGQKAVSAMVSVGLAIINPSPLSKIAAAISMIELIGSVCNLADHNKDSWLSKMADLKDGPVYGVLRMFGVNEKDAKKVDGYFDAAFAACGVCCAVGASYGASTFQKVLAYNSFISTSAGLASANIECSESLAMSLHLIAACPLYGIAASVYLQLSAGPKSEEESSRLYMVGAIASFLCSVITIAAGVKNSQSNSNISASNQSQQNSISKSISDKSVKIQKELTVPQISSSIDGSLGSTLNLLSVFNGYVVNQLQLQASESTAKTELADKTLQEVMNYLKSTQESDTTTQTLKYFSNIIDMAIKIIATINI